MIEVGTEVNIFDREGWESEEGIIISIEGGAYIIKCGKKRYCIPNPSVEINLYVEGDDLEEYILDSM